jgi:lysozyme family protein
MSAFDACLAFTLGQEGGFVDDPRDPGGATNEGVTLSSFRNWMGDQTLTVADLLDMTDDDRAAFYGAGYWNPISGDQLPPAVAMMTNDFAVNAGVRTSAMRLQQVVGAYQDGSIGRLTLDAVAAMDQTFIVGRLGQLRMAYYESLTSLFPIYGAGWTNRTTACEAAATALLPGAAPASLATALAAPRHPMAAARPYRLRLVA